MNRFWERVMLALVVCVPVPALALSGLNVPLPSVVERIAAALVPFAGVATLNDETTLAASGQIVHTSARGTKSTRGPQGRTTVVVRVRRATTKPKQSKARVASVSTPAVSSLAPATKHGEDATPSAPQATRTPTTTPSLSPSASSPSNDHENTKPKPPADLDVTVPTLDVDIALEPEVKLVPDVDVHLVVPELKPSDTNSNSGPGSGSESGSNSGSDSGPGNRDDPEHDHSGHGSGT